VKAGTSSRSRLKQYFGIRSEKLAEFGLTPFRGKTGRTQPDGPNPLPPPTETAAPTE
jgi:hypothetical protein